MDVSGSYKHRDVIFPFYDAPEIAVRVIWYEVPTGTPALPYPHIFTLRDWDRLNDWIEPALGTKYTKPEPWLAPATPCGCTGPKGTAEEWLNGLSYADYIRNVTIHGSAGGKGQGSAIAGSAVIGTAGAKGKDVGQGGEAVVGTAGGKGQGSGVAGVGQLGTAGAKGQDVGQGGEAVVGTAGGKGQDVGLGGEAVVGSAGGKADTGAT